MKRVVAAFLLLILAVFSTGVSFAQTRPRRVGRSGNVPSVPQNPPASPAPKGASSPNTPNAGTRPEPIASPSGAAEEVGDDDVVRVNTTLVTIPVSVMDRNGVYIPDLRQGDFRIYEDGIEQQVAYFASVEKPFTVALMIDTSGSTRYRLNEIQDAAIAFVDELRPDDQVMVVTFDDDINVLIEATNNRRALRDAIRRTRPGEGTRLYDAVDFVINERLNRFSGRKAIVLFTDGVDTTSRRASYTSNVRDAEELDALIYPVQYDTYDDVNSGQGTSTSIPSIILNWPFPFPRNRFPNPRRGGGGGGRSGGSSRGDYTRADAYLRELAQKTGARVQRGDTTGNLQQAFHLIAEELRRQYSLGYYPKTGGQGAARRRISVKVRQPNLVVRARDSYIYNSPANTPNTAGSRQPFAPESRLRPR